MTGHTTTHPHHHQKLNVDNISAVTGLIWTKKGRILGPFWTNFPRKKNFPEKKNFPTKRFPPLKIFPKKRKFPRKKNFPGKKFPKKRISPPPKIFFSRQSKVKAGSKEGQGKVKVRSRECMHNLNRNYNLMGFETIEINLVIWTFWFSAS